MKPFLFQTNKYRLKPYISSSRNQSETGESVGDFKPETFTTYPRSHNLSFFSVNKKNHYATPQLKPELTPEEQELLMALMKGLNLDFKELKLKLSELNITLKNFAQALKENLSALRMASPMLSSLFIPELINHGLLPKILLEKLDSKKNLIPSNPPLFNQAMLKQENYLTPRLRK